MNKFFNKEEIILLFKSCLESLYIIFDKSQIDFWKKYIKIDIEQLDNYSDSSHHLSAYQGMNSLNDIYIYFDSYKNEAWINIVFEDIKSISYYLGNFINRNINLSKSDILSSMGYINSKLEGFHCLYCNYSKASKLNIEKFIAYQYIRDNIIKALMEYKLIDFVNSIINLDIKNIDIERDYIYKLLSDKNIKTCDDNNFNPLCPNCNNKKIVIFRWEKIYFKNKYSIVPSDDNIS